MTAVVVDTALVKLVKGKGAVVVIFAGILLERKTGKVEFVEFENGAYPRQFAKLKEQRDWSAPGRERQACHSSVQLLARAAWVGWAVVDGAADS